MIWFRKRVIFLIVLCVYSFLFLLLILYWMYTENKSSHSESTFDTQDEFMEKIPHDLQKDKKIPVEIWGKASISLFLWKHILRGSVESMHSGFMNVGNLTTNHFEFSFKNGPAFIQTTVPRSVEYLVLVLNGRSPEKVVQSLEWLKYLRNLKHLKRVCVVLLGSEQCDNNWILPHMVSRGGIVDVVFMVYDSTLVDDKEFFQWPLGVAEYRGFPDFHENSIDLLNKRPFIANFVGTVYKNSSREHLVKLIKHRQWTDKIHLIERIDWIPNETSGTREQYIAALRSSDLTLSPVGMNTECYRIYEALSLGSVPVVEDRVTPGSCDRAKPAPLRLLKLLRAPVIWISDWSQLTDVLDREQSLTFKEITRRRIRVTNWYNHFKGKMKIQFLDVLRDKFLD